MGEFRASDADIKNFIWGALQTKLKEVDDRITSTNKERVGYLSGNKPFWIGLVETDDEFPGEGYHDWKNCGIPEDQLKMRLEFRYQTFDVNLLIWKKKVESAMSCIMPLIQSGTLKALREEIEENDYSQLIQNGLTMIKNQYGDIVKKLDTPGFITQLEADYSKGRRRSEYEKSCIVNHIDDTSDWLSGQYMPEVSGDQEKKNASGAKKPTGRRGWACEQISKMPEIERTAFLNLHSGEQRFYDMLRYGADSWCVRYKKVYPDDTSEQFDSAIEKGKQYIKKRPEVLNLFTKN